MYQMYAILSLLSVFNARDIPTKFSQPSIRNKLNTLRKRITSEISTFDGSINSCSNEPLILDNKCGLINTNGVCYFNSVIQSLFSNRSFLLFYLMNDFCDDKQLSLLMQEIACLMLIQSNINPVSFINRLNVYPRLFNNCLIDGGNPKVLLDELLISLYEELDLDKDYKYIDGSPKNFFCLENYTTKCVKCRNFTTDAISSPCINVPFSNSIEESFNFYFNIKDAVSKNKYYMCRTCNTYNKISVNDIKYKIELPQNLIVVFERVKIMNNFVYSIFQETRLNKNIIVKGIQYTLYAAICSHLLPKGYHANAIVKRNCRWIVFNDNKYEVFPYNYEDRNMLNNNAWILLYRKVNI